MSVKIEEVFNKGRQIFSLDVYANTHKSEFIQKLELWGNLQLLVLMSTNIIKYYLHNF